MKWRSPHNRKLPELGGTPLLMGILNLTEDSFSDGGMYTDADSALRRVSEMLDEGADIIDIGAESTRPGAKRVSADLELERLMPILAEIRRNFPEAVLSVDTYKPEVAERAVQNGADIINDVFLFRSRGDCPMARMAARLKAPLIAAHNCRERALKGDFFGRFMEEMRSIVSVCTEAGVEAGSLILDPGVGFGKSVNENFELIARLGELRVFNCPILLGVSRKSALVNAVGDDIGLRDCATSAITALATFEKSADIIRVHNVSMNLAAIKTAARVSEAKWTKLQ